MLNDSDVIANKCTTNAHADIHMHRQIVIYICTSHIYIFNYLVD